MYVEQVPSGKWRGGYRDPTGKRRTRTFPTKTAAKLWAQEQEIETAKGTWRDPNAGKDTFREWHDRWWKAIVVDANTRDKYASHLKVHVLPRWEAVTLDAIGTLEVQGWVRSMEVAGVGVPTILGSHAAFSACLEAATREGKIKANPARGVRMPTGARRPPRFLTTAEVDLILTALTGQSRTLALLAAYTGMRWGEVTGLRVGAIDMLRRQVHVTQVATRHGIKPYPKSTAGYRTLPLTRRVHDALAVHLAGMRRDQLAFTTRHGGIIGHSNFRTRQWIPALETAGLDDPQPTPHDLRHSYASWLIQDGVDVRTVQARLGHESLTTTQRYSHLAPDADARVLAALEPEPAVTQASHDLEGQKRG